jgi:hypothetical protein
MNNARLRGVLFALAATPLLLLPGNGLAQQPKVPVPDPAAAASDMASFFSQVGDQIYEDCIFELSEEQLDIQQALVEAYIKHGAPGALARQLAAKQIQPPQLSDKCEQIKWAPRMALPSSPSSPPASSAPPSEAKRKPRAVVSKAAPSTVVPPQQLVNMQPLPLWDCASNVDYVTITHKGYQRKLSGGEICSPFKDVVSKVSDSVKTFRLGYTIRTGRLFVVSDDPLGNGKTIAWAISGREGCRNNPDPDCLAARAVGPLPPGEYSFGGQKEQRVYWGTRSQRMVAGIYLTKLWHRERFSPAHTAAILKRGSIAIHVRLKGEMSEACLGLEPNAWAYVASLIRDGRATGVNVYIDEPYPQVAENPPIVTASTFSLSSLFK